MKEYEKRRAFVEAARDINEANEREEAVVKETDSGPKLIVRGGVPTRVDALVRDGANISPSSGYNEYIRLY